MYRLIASCAVLKGAHYAYTSEPPKHENLVIMNHASKQLLLSYLRDRNTGTADFVRYSNRLLRLLLEECIGQEPYIESIRQSPTGSEYTHRSLKHEGNYCVVVILRAGLSLMPEVYNIIPDVYAGFILIQRDESGAEKLPKFFYSKFPSKLSEMRILLVDPMLATGGSSIRSIEELLKAGAKEENITFVNLLSCDEGIRNFHAAYPNIKIVTAEIDPELNEDKYIIPGLGDFGDRYFGTN